MTVPLASTWFTGSTVNDALIDTNQTTYIQQALDGLADSGWANLTLAGAYSSTSGHTAQYKTIGDGILYLRGYVQKTSGSFATNTDITVAAAGAVPSDASPASTQGRPLRCDTSTGPSGIAFGYVSTDGSVHVVTGAAVGSLYDLSGLNPILVGF